jgi:hypothetical protein
MIKGILSFLLILISFAAYCQQLHSIKFVYFGEELKPRGTLVISVEKLIKPDDKPLDSIFGRGIKTDMNTFITIRNMAQQIKAKYSVTDTTIDMDSHYGYAIVDSNGARYTLEDKNVTKFFDDLKAALVAKNEDEAVIEILKYY